MSSFIFDSLEKVIHFLVGGFFNLRKNNRDVAVFSKVFVNVSAVSLFLVASPRVWL